MVTRGGSPSQLNGVSVEPFRRSDIDRHYLLIRANKQIDIEMCGYIEEWKSHPTSILPSKEGRRKEKRRQ